MLGGLVATRYLLLVRPGLTDRAKAARSVLHRRVIGPHVVSCLEGVGDALVAGVDWRELVHVDFIQLARAVVPDDLLLELDGPGSDDDDASLSGYHFVFLGLGRHLGRSFRS